MTDERVIPSIRSSDPGIHFVVLLVPGALEVFTIEGWIKNPTKPAHRITNPETGVDTNEQTLEEFIRKNDPRVSQIRWEMVNDTLTGFIAVKAEWDH